MSQVKQKAIDFLSKKFNPIEIATFAYTLLSAIYILCFYTKIQTPFELLLNRFAIVIGILVLSFWNSKNKAAVVEFARAIFPLALIIYWYPETYYLNHGVLIPQLDAFFDQLDISLFDCAPAIEFSKMLPQPWISEIMYFAYFSFFLIYIYVGCLFFFKYRQHFYQTTFIILTGFFLFYIIFIFVPVEGPQFYWKYPENKVPEGCFFSKLMRFTQQMGEKPTGAFPSSHVGMTLIYLKVLFNVKSERKSFWIILPVALLLFASTVYIKAHYLVDVVAAFVAAPVIYWISRKLYEILNEHIFSSNYIENKNRE